VIEWGIIATGTLLINFGLFPRAFIASEARLLASVFYLIVGLTLYARSKSLASYIVRELLDNENKSSNID
jgi:hypothetical protein